MSKLYLDKNVCDIIKIIAAVMVAMHHFSQYICENNISDNFIYKLFSTQGGYLGVAIFFFLSGYGLMESEQKHHLNLTTFFKHRFLKVYLPVLFVTALWLPIIYSVDFNRNISYSGIEGIGLIMRNLFFGFEDKVLWFIKVLALWYSAFFCFSVIRFQVKCLSLYFLLLITILIFIGVYIWLPAYATISIPMFSLGIFASMNKEKTIFKYNATLIVMSILAILQTCLLIGISTLQLAVHSLINYFFIGIIIYVFSKYHISSSKIPIIGTISFSLYLVHNKVLIILKSTMFPISLSYFILFTIVATLVFHFIRIKIVKI